MSMPKCCVEGCPRLADPRWFVHAVNGKVYPACDGCGCACGSAEDPDCWCSELVILPPPEA